MTKKLVAHDYAEEVEGEGLGELFNDIPKDKKEMAMKKPANA